MTLTLLAFSLICTESNNKKSFFYSIHMCIHTILKTCSVLLFPFYRKGLDKTVSLRGLTTNPGFQYRFPIPQAVAMQTGSVEEHQFREHLNKLVTHKSTGLDGMHLPVLMELAHVIARLLWISSIPLTVSHNFSFFGCYGSYFNWACKTWYISNVICSFEKKKS